MDSEALRTRAPLLLAGLGLGLSAFTSGIIASMSLITVPALLNSTSKTNQTVLSTWRASLDLGFRLAPRLAISTTFIHLLTAYLRRSSSSSPTSTATHHSSSARFSLAAAISTVAIIPFTLMVLQPTNVELFRRERAAAAPLAKDSSTSGGVGVGGGGGRGSEMEASTKDLLAKWARINLRRAALPALGVIFACFAL